MITFEDFVRQIGETAKEYTRPQLEQLHREVRQLAKILVAIQAAKINSPQAALDARRRDPTMRTDNIISTKTE